jgi:membrane associated rhomboid family serine protease
VFFAETRGAGVEQAVARFGYGPDNRGLWAALKAAFAHASALHLVGNVYFLLVFGDGVEQRMPRWLYLPAFVVAAVGALLADAAMHPSSVLIGASGGVAALIGACVVLQPRAQVAIRLGWFALRISLRAFFVLALVLLALMAAVNVPGVAWTAHVLGLAFGALGAWMLRAIGARGTARR